MKLYDGTYIITATITISIIKHRTISEIITATSRKTTIELTMTAGGAPNCDDPTTRNLIRNALKNKLEATGSLQCTTSSACQFMDISCSFDATTSIVNLKFTLQQLVNLMDKSVVLSSVEKIKASVDTLSFEINTATKRAVIPFGNASVKNVDTKTTCPANTFQINNECSECPPGYGPSQDTCVICNYGYWSGGGHMPCIPCIQPSRINQPDSVTITTQLKGSINSLSCIPESDVCVVGGEPSLHGALFPPTGARVFQSTVVTGVCPIGSNQEFGVSDKFMCSHVSP